MALTNFPNGVSSFGIPLIGSGPLLTSGKVFFVNSTGGIDANGRGVDPSRPFATLNYAISKVAAGQGDIILLMPGHAESLASAAAVLVNVAGVQIVGLGVGANRPTFTFTTLVGASFDISAANVIVRNLVFTCGIDAQTAMFNVTGADVAFLDCTFNTNSGTIGAILGILTAATAARLRVERCLFLGPAVNTGTTTTAQIKHEVGVDYIIKDSYFVGKCTQNITNATAVLGGLITDNRFVTYTGTKSINMHASSTPFIVNNRFNVPSGTAPIVAAAGFVAGNLYSAAAGVTAPTAATF